MTISFVHAYTLPGTFPDTLDGDGGAMEDGDVGGERPNDRRGGGGGGGIGGDDGAGSGGVVVRRAFVRASLSL
jgi:hypothetical protein